MGEEFKHGINRREAIVGLIGAVGLGAYALSRETSEDEHRDTVNPEERENPQEADYFRHYENGEFSPSERKSRKHKWAEGVEVFEDIGLTFYVVQKGDTIEKIRNKLSNIKKFDYLKDQRAKIQSFNIPERELVPGMYIPIPLENEDRHISDTDFAREARLALNHISDHRVYGPYIQHLREEYSDEEIIAVMVAMAKQESGGEPIGQFELHRWEPGHNVFSFSIFHILMEGPGLEARRRLGRTEGQLYHPRNASELFFAYMVEKLDEKYKNNRDEKGKIEDDLVNLFRLDERMATFYNGGGWKKGNPHYLRNIQKYRGEARKMLKNR